MWDQDFISIDIWRLSILYRYVDILSGDRMIIGISNSIRLATVSVALCLPIP